VPDPDLPRDPEATDPLRDALRAVPDPAGIDVDAHFGSVLQRARAQRRTRRRLMVAVTSGVVAVAVLGGAFAVARNGDGSDPIEVADGPDTPTETTAAPCPTLASACGPAPGSEVPCASDAGCDAGTVDTGPADTAGAPEEVCPVPAELPTRDGSELPGRLVVGSTAPGALATALAGEVVSVRVEEVDLGRSTWSSTAVISRWDGSDWSATYLVDDVFSDTSTLTALDPEETHLAAILVTDDAPSAGRIELPDDVPDGLLRVELGAYSLPFAETSARATMYAYVLVGCGDDVVPDTSSTAVATEPTTTSSTTTPSTDAPEPTTPPTATPPDPTATVAGTYTCGPADGPWISAVATVAEPGRVRVQIEVDGVAFGHSHTVTAEPGQTLEVGFDPLLTDDAYAVGVGTLRLLDGDAPEIVLAEATVTLRLPTGVQCG
jgi:hypothetical protein